MKLGRIFCFIFFIFIFGLFNISVADAKGKWPRTTGNMCWEFTYKGELKGILKFRVMNMGDGHYILSGPGNTKEAIYGTAIIGEDKVYLTTTSAGSDSDETWSFIGRWVMDKKTLDGEAEIMGVGHDKNDPDPETAYTAYDGGL